MSGKFKSVPVPRGKTGKGLDMARKNDGISWIHWCPKHDGREMVVQGKECMDCHRTRTLSGAEEYREFMAKQGKGA